MRVRVLVIALTMMVIFQVVFSFYYSSEIVNQNQKLYKNQDHLTSLLLDAEKLNEKWSQVSSMKELEVKINDLKMSPINKRLENE